MSAAIFVMIVAWGGILQSKKWAAGLESLRLLLRVCLEAGFDSEKCQFFDETRRLFEEHTLRYGRKKQRWIIKKVAFAAQSLASKHTLMGSLLLWVLNRHGLAQWYGGGGIAVLLWCGGSLLWMRLKTSGGALATTSEQ